LRNTEKETAAYELYSLKDFIHKLKRQNQRRSSTNARLSLQVVETMIHYRILGQNTTLLATLLGDFLAAAAISELHIR